jgi:hypothetical protein
MTMRLKNGKNQEYRTIRKQGTVKRCVLQQPDESEHELGGEHMVWMGRWTKREGWKHWLCGKVQLSLLSTRRNFARGAEFFFVFSD